VHSEVAKLLQIGAVGAHGDLRVNLSEKLRQPCNLEREGFKMPTACR
jgi:hypothetical protein